MKECKCGLATKLVGDGCHICRPTYAYEMACLTIKDLEADATGLEWKNKDLRESLWKATKTIEALIEECRTYRMQGAAEYETSTNMDIAQQELGLYREALAKGEDT